MYSLYIMVCLFATLCVAETNIYDREWLEIELDKAQMLTRCTTRIDIYTNILHTISSNELVHSEYDGANALFVVCAGLSWGYFHTDNTNYYPLGLEYGLRARKIGYETGVAGHNPERFADHLNLLALYYEKEPVKNSEEQDFYSQEAWETWPYFNGYNLNMWRRKRSKYNYEPKKGIPVALEVINNAPFCNTLFYRNCGWNYILLEDYRKAFAIWHRGLIDGEPHYWRSPTPHRIIQYIEYATLDELEETKRLFRLNAAKYPATLDTIEDVTGWLNWANNEHLNFEIQLRIEENNHNIEVVTNLLKLAIVKYHRPYYADKLGDTNTLVKLYCDRIKEEVWWWAIPEYSLLPKVKQLLESGHATSETSKYYTKTLAQLYVQHPKYIKKNQEWFVNIINNK